MPDLFLDGGCFLQKSWAFKAVREPLENGFQDMQSLFQEKKIKMPELHSFLSRYGSSVAATPFDLGADGILRTRLLKTTLFFETGSNSDYLLFFFFFLPGVVVYTFNLWRQTQMAIIRVRDQFQGGQGYTRPFLKQVSLLYGCTVNSRHSACVGNKGQV